MGLPEELAVRHQQKRDEALNKAQQVANQMVTHLYNIGNVESITRLEIDALQRQLNDLRTHRTEALDHDRDYRQNASIALQA